MTTFCEHGYKYHACPICEDDVDIDKCLNCGKYKLTSQLNSDQCCKQGCTNPQEYDREIESCQHQHP